MPDSPAAHNSLGNTLRELKQPLHAIAAHEMALQVFNSLTRLHFSHMSEPILPISHL